MKQSLNQITLIGNVGRDPEQRYTPGGNAVTNFSVATSYGWQDKSGEWQNETEWHNATCWNKLAEDVNAKVSKGDKVFVQGRLKTETWTTEDGTQRSKTKIIADTVILLKGGNQGGGGSYDESDGGSQEYGDYDLPF